MEDKIISNENINKMRELTDSIVSDEALNNVENALSYYKSRIRRRTS